MTRPAAAPAWGFHALTAALALLAFAFANLRSPIVNEDGVLYLLLAERIGEQGLASVFALFDRPFYSWLIAAIHAPSGLSLQHSALALDALLSALLAVSFVEFCRLLYRDPRVMPWAALLILAHPKLNNYFGFVFRDVGYWALLFASFCALLHHLDTPRPRLLAAWALCTLAAAAFRPEAMLFGLLLPPVLLLASREAGAARLRPVLVAYALMFGLLALALLLSSLQPGVFAEPMRELHELPAELWRDIPASFLAASERYAQTVLDPYSRDFAALSFAGGLLTLLLAKVLNGLGPLQCALLLRGWWCRSLAPAPQSRLAFALLLGGATLLAAAFLAYRHFLDTRYVMLVCLLALAPAARALQQIAARLQARGTSAARAGALLAALAFGADFALGLDRPKPYLLDCAAWLGRSLPAGALVFSNDKQLAYHSGARWDWQTTHDANLLIAGQRVPQDGATHWIVHLKRGQDELARQLEHYRGTLAPLHRCDDPRGASVQIYSRVGAPAP